MSSCPTSLLRSSHTVSLLHDWVAGGACPEDTFSPGLLPRSAPQDELNYGVNTVSANRGMYSAAWPKYCFYHKDRSCSGMCEHTLLILRILAAGLSSPAGLILRRCLRRPLHCLRRHCLPLLILRQVSPQIASFTSATPVRLSATSVFPHHWYGSAAASLRQPAASLSQVGGRESFLSLFPLLPQRLIGSSGAS